MGILDLFRTATEEEIKYREFLESKSKEFISILPNKITKEYTSYDLTQFKSITEKMDFIFNFLDNIEMYGPYSSKDMELFFNKKYSEILYYFYDISEKNNEYLIIREYGDFLDLKNIKAEVNIYENRIDFRFQKIQEDECDDDDYYYDYDDDDDSDTYDRGSFLFQKTNF